MIMSSEDKWQECERIKLEHPNGTQIDRLAWIAEAETEQAKIEIELIKLQ